MRDQFTVSVVVPTYNERDNVAPLVARLSAALRGTPAEIVFVDDSDDGTDDVARSQQTDLTVRVIHRPPARRAGGLSTAVLEGIDAAQGTYICIMDGDLQHPPETIPALVQRADDTGAQIVMASRNVTGGSNAGLDGPWRRFVSWSLGMVARALFYEKLRKVRDPLSGFLLVRRSALDGVVLRPVGFKISLEVLIRAAGSRVEEVGYTFGERAAGETKASLGTGLTFARHVGVLLLEVPEVGRFWKFAFVGGSGVVIFLSMLGLLTELAGLPYLIAWLLAAEGATLSNFALNRNFTWFERRSEGARGVIRDGVKYHIAAAGPTLIANFLTLLVLKELVGASTLLAGAIAVWVGVATSFLGAEKVVFTTRRRLVRRMILPPSKVEGEPQETQPAGTPAVASPNKQQER
jgi:glycosyltransferase involved in cell wall biosynthesis